MGKAIRDDTHDEGTDKSMMHKKEDIVLVAGGGHCKSSIDVIESQNKYQIFGIVDLKENVGKKVLGYDIIACDDDLPELIKDHPRWNITIGHVPGCNKKTKLFLHLKDLGAEFPVIVSPHAYVSKHASLGEGTIVMHNVTINSEARIGSNCIINTGAIIEHDSQVGNNCHISTGCIINGACSIDYGVFIGSNSVLINNIHVAAETVIGADSFVRKSITQSGIYAGIPLKRIVKDIDKCLRP